ncbi:MAG: hypothetical protein JW818_17525 [Pirellulales bacterium]|nr:hypothetical protein [Pirellulales bacterium]
MRRSSCFPIAAMVLVGLLLIVVIGTVAWMRYMGSKADRQIAALRAAGQPVSLADLKEEPVPDEENAAYVLEQARDELDGVMKAIYATEEAESKAAEEALFAREEAGEEIPEEEYEDDEEVSEGVMKTVRAMLAAHPDVLPQLAKAANCPKYWVEDYTDCVATAGMNPRWEMSRGAARLLGIYSNACLLADGKRDEALENCVTALKLSRHFSHEPTMIGYLIAIACRGIAIESANRTLQSGPVSGDVRKALEEELGKHDTFKMYRHALVTERAAVLDSTDDLCEQYGWGGFLVRREIPAILDMFEESLDRVDRIAEGKDPGEESEPSGMFASLLGPCMGAGEDAARRDEALLRSLRILLALLDRPDPNAPAPDDLTKLGLPREATLDPFTGKPLVVKKVDGGWLIYTVGPDLQDDGGSFDDGKDFGLAPPPKALKNRQTR